MKKTERIMIIILMAAWIVLPDLIPGPIDDLVVIFGLIKQIANVLEPKELAEN